MKKLPKRKIYRYCLADIAKGLFNGMIGNYLLYFFQPTVKSGLPVLLPENKLLGFITIMALITALGKIVDAVTDPLVATLSDKCTHKDGRRMPEEGLSKYAIKVEEDKKSLRNEFIFKMVNCFLSRFFQIRRQRRFDFN